MKNYLCPQARNRISKKYKSHIYVQEDPFGWVALPLSTFPFVDRLSCMTTEAACP